MAQHDFEIDNQTAPAFRTDLNNALEALATLSSGATAPTTTYPNMLWYDSANNLLKMRTEADDAWISIGTLNQSTNTFEVANLTELTQGQAEDDTNTTFGLVSGERLGQAVAANAPSAIDFQEFTSSGTWTKPTGAKMLLVEIVGGGGAGGKCGNGDIADGGAGGGAGLLLLPASFLGSSEAVTVGAGGAARTSNGAGSDGGTTSFSIYTATGGEGGGFFSGGGGSSPGTTAGTVSPGNIAQNYPSGDGGAVSTIASDGADADGPAGGGSADEDGSGNSGNGGVSTFFGNGGDGVDGSGTAGSGGFPGGGGGASAAAGNSGAGGDGRVRIWAW